MPTFLELGALRVDLRAAIVRLVFFFGPVGALVPIPGTPHSFRAYYLLLPALLAIFLLRGVRRLSLLLIAIFSPLLVYALISASFYYLSASTMASDAGAEGNPIARLALLIFLICFCIAAYDNARRLGVVDVYRNLKAAFYGFAVSLIAGYVFLVGYASGRLSITVIEHFNVLTQFAYGLLRFSPGSYPNEYGIVSSFFLSAITLILFERNKLLQRQLLGALGRIRGLFWLAALGGLFFSTTRAAYLAYAAAMLYLVFMILDIKRAIKFVSITLLLFIGIAVAASPYFDPVKILKEGYLAFFNKAGSAYERVTAFNDALYSFSQSPILGTGFGSLDMMHNTYLQLIFGLGFVGTILLAVTIVAVNRVVKTQMHLSTMDESATRLLVRVRNIGFIHVLSFAISNHNLNHFLTWLVFYIYFYVPGKDERRGPSVGASTIVEITR